jgi:hypothetical protein
MITSDKASARKYGEVIRRAWWTYGPPAGERTMSCDHAAGVVIVRAQTVADDVLNAIDATRGLVIGPLERAALPLPQSVVVIVAAVQNSGRRNNG